MEFMVSIHVPVSMKIFDVLGRVVAALVDHEVLILDRHKRIFEAESLPNGVSYYRMTAANFEQTKKLILLK